LAITKDCSTNRRWMGVRRSGSEESMGATSLW
jgi:hypothetical protein